MATSSFLGIDADNLAPGHSATGIDSLGPSDASDSGSDSAGAYSADADSDTDRFGTGERGSVEQNDEVDSRDILPDHVELLSTDGSANVSPDDAMQDGNDDDVEGAVETSGLGTPDRQAADHLLLSADAIVQDVDDSDDENQDSR